MEMNSTIGNEPNRGNELEMNLKNELEMKPIMEECLMNDKLLVEKTYVEISSYRLKTLKSIGTNVKIPKQIAKDCGIKQNHISKTLNELKTHGLIECINEEVRKGRLYRLTPFGLSVLEEVQ